MPTSHSSGRGAVGPPPISVAATRASEGFQPLQRLHGCVGTRIAQKTYDELRRLIESPGHREQGCEMAKALLEAMEASSSPDAYVKSPQKQWDIKIEAGPTDEELRQVVEQDIGPKIFKQASRFSRGPMRRAQDLIVDQMLENEDLKRRMIGFLDVVAGASDDLLPVLFRKYFPPGTVETNSLLGSMIKIGRLISGTKLTDKILTVGIRWTLQVMFKRFFVGQTVEEALATIKKLRDEKGLYASLNYVTEHVASPVEADRYNDVILTQLMGQWAAMDYGPAYTTNGKNAVPSRHISVKSSGMYHRFHPMGRDEMLTAGRERLLKVFQKAKAFKEQGKPFLINLDPEDRSTVDLYYSLFWKTITHESLNGWDDAGLVVQCYLRNADTLLMRQLVTAKETGKKIQVRLVKGAYHQYEWILSLFQGLRVPVFVIKKLTDACYLRQLRIALANREHIRLVVASHDHETVGQALGLMKKMGIHPSAVEFDFLTGVGEPNAYGLTQEEFNQIVKRMYGPFGTPPEAMPYEVRRLGEVNKDSAIGRTHATGTFENYIKSKMKAVRAWVAPKPLEFVNEPAQDLGDPAVLRRMQEAIASVRDRKEDDKPCVGPMIASNQVVNNAEFVNRVNPNDHTHVLGTAKSATVAQAQEAVRVAQAGFEKVSLMSAEERSQKLRNAAEILRGKKDMVAAEIVCEIGKPADKAWADVEEAIDFLEKSALQALKLKGRAPAGVGVSICPFNFFAIAMGQAARMLAGGNAVIMKPADQTPIVSRHVVDILREAGFPVEAVQYCPGDAGVGQALVEHQGVDLIAFTGSKATADKIVKTAADHPSARIGHKIVVAETGGKNPLIVGRTADLDVAVEAIIRGAFEMNGERCSAISRVYVVESKADELVKRLKAAAAAMVVGDPSQVFGAQLGSQIDAAALAKAKRYIDTGCKSWKFKKLTSPYFLAYI